MRAINLVPPQIAERRKAKRQKAILAGAFGLLIVTLASVWGVRHIQLSNQQERQAIAERRANAARAKVNALQEFGLLDQTVKQKGATLTQAMAADIGWSRLLRELAETMPPDSWLTGMKATSEVMPAAGAPVPPAGSAPASAAPAPAGPPVPGPTARAGTITFTGVTFDFPGVATWITKMQQMKSFQNVFVTSGTKSKIGSKEVVNFTGSVDLNNNVASGRYVQTGGR